MGSRAFMVLLSHRGAYINPSANAAQLFLTFGQSPFSPVKIKCLVERRNHRTSHNFSTAANSSLEPPNLPRLAETARISLTPDEVEEFAPKMKQVVDWFGQLQAIDLESIEPAMRADTEDDNSRDDLPQIFENREAIIKAMPSYEEPYIKVPKVLNKE
ncbi:glutamyl-tRNA(Gln) amidotransferase subunit C, chloroplastic/mitochondrial [Coffea eugenioides]|uniref:Glutamyl-tRNA(Gln) amidotransferase subunit C, chloroplastic/mitochondrial n=1 Tax=Coffea arabica TaxID=13443 RepID=A0A6P6TWN0_COFAR|nr:glutamyl-tRNA(Gln) amidotransferase subunit C, chloroplastic/mitochondrial-like [Coffea arabica]XP_027082755.1 glutamyl-tRNA(Gln) amidotransferase subunit C, chloroplastic/mitochondrial-like [Coffea arabica]XP_027183439.1 glutamyl-tRNA(Gln) amidotransferase subunit C, chloroplastic/mitochondrial [Coffea eugenioides]XP_027183440.1 glutamyl-tRNA(Gln) amidotransferase subunit C, chloroplastic/mitochondrial [Coffea eugenioides]